MRLGSTFAASTTEMTCTASVLTCAIQNLEKGEIQLAQPLLARVHDHAGCPSEVAQPFLAQVQVLEPERNNHVTQKLLNNHTLLQGDALCHGMENATSCHKM
eukprot:894475-Amphidinium_carterae.2